MKGYRYKRFREVRKNRGYTQKEVALFLGMDRTQYSRYERGRVEIPLRIAVEFAKRMFVSIDYLVGLTDVDIFDPF